MSAKSFASKLLKDRDDCTRDERAELERLFNEHIAPGTPAEALERAEDFATFVDSAIVGLRHDIEKEGDND